ncbi:hypothetical protein NL390_27110, partial [Klebsiella pneumoniae]|nr:hypothetical protein [Klebsiella pneumoniae]
TRLAIAIKTRRINTSYFHSYSFALYSYKIELMVLYMPFISQYATLYSPFNALNPRTSSLL